MVLVTVRSFLAFLSGRPSGLMVDTVVQKGRRGREPIPPRRPFESMDKLAQSPRHGLGADGMVGVEKIEQIVILVLRQLWLLSRTVAWGDCGQDAELVGLGKVAQREGGHSSDRAGRGSLKNFFRNSGLVPWLGQCRRQHR